MPYPDLSRHSWPQLNDLREAARYTLLSKYSDVDPFNFSRNIGCARTVGKYLPPAAAKNDFNILEFGCGPFNPFAIGIVFYLNGYPQITAGDIGFPLHQYVAARAMYDAALHAIAFPAQWALGDSSEETLRLIRQRAHALPLASLDAGKYDEVFKMQPRPFEYLSLSDERDHFKEASYDYIYSVSVFEHVMEPQKELEWHYKLLREGGQDVLVIDFRDHRFLEDPDHFAPWSYMEDGVYGAQSQIRGDLKINGLRSSQLRMVAEAAGFHVERWDEEATCETPQDLQQRVRPEFKTLPSSDLTTFRVTALLSKDRKR